MDVLHDLVLVEPSYVVVDDEQALEIPLGYALAPPHPCKGVVAIHTHDACVWVAA